MCICIYARLVATSITFVNVVWPSNPRAQRSQRRSSRAGGASMSTSWTQTLLANVNANEVRVQDACFIN